jgi:hypothetical protein
VGRLELEVGGSREVCKPHRPWPAESKPLLGPRTPCCPPPPPQGLASKNLSLYKQGHRKANPLSVISSPAPAQSLGWNRVWREPPRLLPFLLYLCSLASSSSLGGGWAPRSLIPTSWRREAAIILTQVKALSVLGRSPPPSSLPSPSSFLAHSGWVLVVFISLDEVGRGVGSNLSVG